MHSRSGCVLFISSPKKLPNRGEAPHLFLILGAGVTPAQGSVKPSGGFTFNYFSRERGGICDSDRRAVYECQDCFQRCRRKTRSRPRGLRTEMRRDGDVVHRAKRMVGWGRLLIENVEAGARDSTFAQCGDQIGLDDDRSARRVDQIRVAVSSARVRAR